MQNSIDTLLQGAVDRGDVPGVAAMVVNGQDTLYQGAFGERALGGGDAMTLDTVVAIHSMTKAVAAAAVMQLVEKGQLSLDEPAAQVLPFLGEVEVLDGFADNGAPILRAPKTAITLRHPLTHTAGFGYEMWNQEYLDYVAATGALSVLSRKKASLQIPLLFDPGSRWNYGINIDWAGFMLEEVTGLTLGDYMQANIFEPLGMTSTAFKVSAEMATRQARLHMRGEDGSLSLPETTAASAEPDFDAGGGGLSSTVQDYARFTQMILNKGAHEGRQILAPETVAMMSANQMGDTRVQKMKTFMPPLSNDAEFFPGVEKAWGLSFMINLTQAPTGRSPGSLSWAGLGNSYFWIDPARDIAGIYTTQLFPFCDEKSLPLFLDFETAAYDGIA